MIQIIISDTWAEREKLIGYSKEKGFSETISRLKEIKSDTDLAGIVTSSFEKLIRLFTEFTIVDGRSCGSSILINSKKELYQVVERNIISFHEGWLLILHDLSEDIDELFRYGATDNAEDVIFLKNLLLFLTFVDIYDDREKFLNSRDI